MKARLNKQRRRRMAQIRDAERRRARRTDKPMQKLKGEWYDHRPNRQVPSEGQQSGGSNA